MSAMPSCVERISQLVRTFLPSFTIDRPPNTTRTFARSTGLPLSLVTTTFSFVRSFAMRGATIGTARSRSSSTLRMPRIISRAFYTEPMTYCRSSLAGVLFALASLANAAPTGEEVYQSHCASCHDQNTPRIPPRDALQKLHAARILRTLDFGLMMNTAYPLKREEREAVANFLGIAGEETLAAANACSSDKRALSGSALGNWNGWSPTLDNARYQPNDKAGVTIGQLRGLKLKWAYGFPGDIIAFAAPTVFNGSLFVGSASGAIQALDAKTGCTHWMFQANGPVRMALLAVPNGNQTSLIFGDQIGWVYSLDASTGKQLWRRRIEDHEATRLTGSPIANDGIVYIPAASWEETRSLDPQYACCTFRGSLTALHVRDGSVVWKTFLIDAP